MSHRILFCLFLLLTAVAVAAQPGQSYALFFAVDTYQDSSAYRPLETPVRQAKSLARVLERAYGFQTEVVENPSLGQIEAKLAEYATRFADSTYATDGQLLVFFSGRGQAHYGQGYFLPSNTQSSRLHQSAFMYFMGKYLLESIPCRHLLVVVDAPYSYYVGSATDTEKAAFTGSGEGEKMLQQHQETRSRLVLTSGDSTGQTPDQSDFAERFREALAQSGGADSTLTFPELCGLLGQGGTDIHRGSFGKHEAGGNFLFIRNIAAADSLSWQRAMRAGSCTAYQSYMADYPAGKYREAAAQLVEMRCGQQDSTQVEANAPIGNTYNDGWPVQLERNPDFHWFIYAELEPKALNYGEVLSLIGDPLEPFPKKGDTKKIKVSVIVRILVDDHGNYVRHRVINDGHPIVSKAIVPHLPKLIFTPAIQHGKPIYYWVNMGFHFERS
ncbi:MAG: caspase family protein [Bacteroidia bacterium]